MPFPYGVTVTLVHRVLNGLDDYGNDTYRDQPETITGCVVSPAGSSEVTQFTDQVSTNVTVHLPYGTAVGAIDALVINGERYEIQGEPRAWTPSPFSGNTSPVEVQASRVTGASV